ncbi:N-acetylglucosamine-6P-responsive transcriptional repressor NagC [Klebsiella pneumoniae subsp. ozaenae]|uniref:N-acetylglucosamine-6P-responsive transcriptional repressor NagC n=1 Tax=Klebsiella pneumoniae subsp. ozaenae TaxID=574 RepID=A0A378BWG4_KLEPO|nr:N-acetylglucosamine-6P-responsive transcriptional repressor NagC [Klebsiella pneumoniae subsp. ozaenae]
MTKITRQLIERGLIKEVDQQASTGGRRAISIIAETRNFNAIGVRLGRYGRHSGPWYDLSSKTLEEEHFPLPERTQETLEHALLNIIATFYRKLSAQNSRADRYLSDPAGLVDPESGVIRYMPHIAVENWGLVGGRWRNASTLPALLATISAAWRWPSTILAQARIAKTPFWCACTAVPGAGIISNGRIFIGRNGNVGEIGHIQVDPLGERCHCGNFGCLGDRRGQCRH